MSTPKINCTINAELSQLIPSSLIQEKMLQQPSDEYNFLHDCAIFAWNGVLFAAWYNCPQFEMADASVIRGRRSFDNGASWSECEIFAADPDKRFMLLPPAFVADDKELYLWVSRMSGADLVEELEIWKYNPASGKFHPAHIISERFIANTNMVTLPNGNRVIAGRIALTPGTKPLLPAVAVNCGDSLLFNWRFIPLKHELFCRENNFIFPESALMVLDENQLVLFVRREKGPGIYLFSDDNARSWSAPLEHNIPASQVKMAAGRLSNGCGYFIGSLNDSRRNKLMLYLENDTPGCFERCYLLQDGLNKQLQAEPEWSYPSCCELDGQLHIVYTSAKRAAVHSMIPINELTQ